MNFYQCRLVMPLLPKETDYVHHVSTGPQKFSKLPTALGDPKKKYLLLSIGDGKFSVKDLHNSGLTPQGKKFSSSLALKNDATHTSSAITKTVNNIQAKHMADFCSDLAVENMDCTDESALSMGEENFCPQFIADDTDINRLSLQQETAVCCEEKNGSEKNDSKKIDEIFCSNFISDDTDINGLYSHQETAVCCEAKNGIEKNYGEKIDEILGHKFILDDEETTVDCVTKNDSVKCDVKKIDVNFHPQFPSDEMDTKQYGTKKSCPHPIRTVGCEAKNDSVDCDVKK